MKTWVCALIASTLLGATGVASAGPRYYDGPCYHRHGGNGVGGLVLGLALAVPLIALANQHDRGSDVVYLPPPAPVPPPPPQTVYVPPPAYVPSRPEPVIYPRNGQSNLQLESDTRECNRWATTRQAAMADGTVFRRAVEACMDGRGYTLR